MRLNYMSKMKKNKIKQKKEVQLNMMQWLARLKTYELEFLRDYKISEYEAESKFLIEQIDCCYTAALIEELNIPLDVIEFVMFRAGYMLKENADMLGELGRRNYYMKLSELEKVVKEKMIKMVQDGCKQNEIIKICKAEFKTLKACHINLAYKNVLEEFLESQREGNGEMGKNTEVMQWLKDNEKTVLMQEKKKTIKEIMKNFDLTETTAVTYFYRWKKEAVSANSIPAENKKTVVLEKKVTKEDKAKIIAEKVAAELEKEVIKADPVKEVEADVITTEKTKSKLKVVSRSLVVDGEFGNYILSDEGLKVGDMTFTTKEGVENYYKQELDKLNNRVNEYREVFNLA